MASPSGLSSSENGGWGPRTIRERERKKEREREREPNRSHIAFYDLALKVTQHHCCHILLVKVITKVCPG